MRKVTLGEGFAMFVLFFFMALVDAFAGHDWWMAGFWLFTGCMFIVADNIHRKKTGQNKKV